jgi:hypothetical protein
MCKLPGEAVRFSDRSYKTGSSEGMGTLKQESLRLLVAFLLSKDIMSAAR